MCSALVRVVAGAALTASLAGLAACTADRAAAPERPAVATSRGPQLPPPRTTHDNEAATAAYADWLLHAVPMPAGAREWSRSPLDQFRRATLGVSPSDPRFQRTTWWTVPLGLGDLGSWVASHVPKGLRLEDGTPSQSMSMGRTEYDVDLLGASTATHTGSVLNLAIVERAGGIVVRVDTFVAARFVRTALVPDDAASVTLRRVRAATTGHRPASRTAVRRLTDPAVVRRVVDLVNRQPAAMTVENIHGCPAMLGGTVWTLTFATGQGEWTAVGSGDDCYPALVLRHDGVRVGPTLEPGRAFDDALDRFLRSASGPAGPGS
ncbi:hypothetical protein [Nocardioides jiangxiensis]|uniref:Uncharacterized protein n=1 Tax=Nocardioides jiangxiensis TaxID=3064524 RepID=A0ABT9B3N9_9ACTN|nr:hypothetical protein [Nocardioides sp. WY-20]MDO7869456.1 hypothetical protein [Nocardioides sp. WY-20]